jgi:hypothetical protein
MGETISFAPRKAIKS